MSSTDSEELHATGSVSQNFAWTLFANVFYMGCQWAITIVIAKLGSPELLGRFTLAVAICSPIMLLSGMALRVVLANDARDERPFAVYMGLRIASTVVAFATIAIIGLAGRYSREATAVILLFGAAKAAEAISDVLWGKLQQREHMIAISVAMVLKGAAALGGFTAMLAISGDLTLATLSLAAGWIATLILYDLPTTRRYGRTTLRPQFGSGPMIRLAVVALPLGIGTMLVSLATNIPRYFLSHDWGDRELGMYSAIVNLSVVGMSVMTALGQVMAPQLSRCYARGDRRGFLRRLKTLIVIALLLGVVGIGIAAVMGHWTLRILYTREYAGHAHLFLIAMIAGAIGHVLAVCGVALNAAGMFRPQVPLQILNALTVLLVAYLVIPTWGSSGAIWAVVAGNGIAMVLGAVLVMRSLRELARRGGELRLA